MRQLTDAELMALVREGDFAAFDEIYNRYSASIRRFLFSLTWDQETAADYLQEVFLRLYKARDRYEPTGKFSTYLFQIAKNYYLGQVRRRRVESISLSEPDRNGRLRLEHIRANERIEPEVHLLSEYRKWRIRQAISALPEGQKMVFVLSHFEDFGYADISEALEIPVGTVKSRMFNAVKTLRGLLKEEL